MTKLKKHQLLEKAMKDYPKGTVINWGEKHDLPNYHNLTGIYRMHDDYVVDSNDIIVYNNSEWAEIIPETKPSILDGKVAIQVNNEREFKLLMEHYEGKGWIDRDWISKNGMLSTTEYWTYNEECYRPKLSEVIETGYKIIPFSDFAAEVGIKVPKFIMKSEDDQPIYERDSIVVVRVYDNEITNSGWTAQGNVMNEKNGLYKYFVSLTAAKAWIKEQNKPKYKEVELFNGMTAKVYTGEILINDGKRTATTLMPSDLEDLINAYRSLKGKEVGND